MAFSCQINDRLVITKGAIANFAMRPVEFTSARTTSGECFEAGEFGLAVDVEHAHGSFALTAELQELGGGKFGGGIDVAFEAVHAFGRLVVHFAAVKLGKAMPNRLD